MWQLLLAADFNSFIDAVETEHVEFKSGLYQLDNDSQKQELAKDVSGLANAGGGVILIGFKTTKDSTILGDYVTELRAVPKSCFQAEQYRSILQDWIYPSPKVNIRWFNSDDPERGYIAIEVNAGGPELSPRLIKRFVSEDGRRVDAVFGYVERKQVDVPRFSVQQLHALLRSGRRAEEVSHQYRLIQDTLQQLVDAQTRESEAESANAAQKKAEFERDKRQALAAGGFELIPSLLICAYPIEPVQMRGLFDPRQSELIQVLQAPPRLKGNGWDLAIDDRMDNIHGRMRRSLKEGWKLLQLTREGSLMFLARGLVNSRLTSNPTKTRHKRPLPHGATPR